MDIQSIIPSYFQKPVEAPPAPSRFDRMSGIAKNTLVPIAKKVITGQLSKAIIAVSGVTNPVALTAIGVFANQAVNAVV